MSLTARQRSIHNKNGAKRSTSFKGKRSRKSSEGEVLVASAGASAEARGVWFPGGAAALALLLCARVAAALTGQIHDCDETFNYWEPLHYLVYGSGLQTWEYSPEFAIRSYFSLWLFAAPAKLMSYFMSSVTIFYTIRVVLAVLTACAELMFYKAVCREFGVHVGRVWLALALPAAGAAVSTGALLPSAVAAPLAAAAAAAWWQRRVAAAVALTAASALLCWPFTALLGVPLALDLVLRRGELRAVLRAALWAAAAALLPAMLLDSWTYGRVVLPAWSIVRYNVLSGRGPALYGTEPWTYYFVNGLLNFNIVWVLFLLCPCLLALCSLSTHGGPRPAWCTPRWLALAPPYLWLAVFVAQPHKEERFLYPAYSLILLCGAVAVDCLQKLTYFVCVEVLRLRAPRERRHYLAYTAPLCILLVALAGLAGVSRSVALHRNYRAPLSIVRALPPAPAAPGPPPAAPRLVCYGKEWHRAAPSFLLPRGYETRFVRSEFAGQLPAPYGKEPNATRVSWQHFNDRNTLDARTLVAAASCHYLVDSSLGAPTALQPDYRAAGWTVAASLPLLDAARSPPGLRAFYVPAWTERTAHWTELMLLQNNELH